MRETRFGAVVAALALAAACSAPPSVDDAGVDGGSDAGVDAGSDAGVDAGTDAGVDGGVDAGLDVALTYYWVASQADYTGVNDTPLCDVNGQTIALVPLAFANALRLEGTGRLLDGGMLNVGGNCTCPSGMTTCYVVLDPARFPWGIGVGNRALAPYRSIAVDRQVIPLGSRVFAPQLVGKTMPGSYGFLHDGCLQADDVGGGIVGAHIDFFVGEKSSYLTLDSQLGLSTLRVRVLFDAGCPDDGGP